MSNAYDRTGPLPPMQPGDGWFEPTPEKLAEEIAAIRAAFGKQSMEYASILIRLGDAHMRQGLLSNPRAQASYEEALGICRARGEATPETAWLYDKLANVKQSSGDTVGAQADLEKALSLWKDHSAVNALAPVPNENHVARRKEDLERLQRVNEFQGRQPPPLDDEPQ